jgi:predicted RNA binding protein YcfA (HicA-like mRNA interferase family)
VLSGQDVLRLLGRFGFVYDTQRGSHVKVRRVLTSGTRQSLTVPLHREMDRGTLMAIYRQALRYLSEEELHDHFFG